MIEYFLIGVLAVVVYRQLNRLEKRLNYLEKHYVENRLSRYTQKSDDKKYPLDKEDIDPDYGF